MAKKNKKSKKSQRNLNTITKNDNLLRYKTDYTDIMDNRELKPLASDYPMDIFGKKADLYYDDKIRRTYDGKVKVYHSVRFNDPMRSVVCRRRKDRRKHLFIMRVIGRGRGVRKFRRRRMTRYSHISC